MNERRRILHDDGGGADVVTLRVTTTDGSTNVGIEMVVTNGNNVYPVTTDSQGKVEMTGLSGGCTIDCETHEISVYEFIATGTMTVDISAYVNSFPVGETRSFNYTGAVSEVQLIPGSYKLQVWGAQGGTYSSYTGGKGGYSEGILTLLQALKVYVFVGGHGGRSGNGGWNGGGGGSGSASYTSGGTSGSSYMACGGGGTDIALVTSSMAYSSYRTNRSSESLLSRIIVAGGGSGGAYTTRSETTTNSITYNTNDIPEANGFIPDDDNSIWRESDKWHGAYISVSSYRGGNCRIKTKNGRTDTKYSFTKNNPTTQGATISYASGYSGTVRGSSADYTVTIPSDASYFYIYYKDVVYSSIIDSVTLSKSSTSSSSDYAYGYVGGGASGGGNYPGKQNAAGTNGAFGLGANQTTTNYRHCSACGGGGWYGGGGGQYSDSSTSYVGYSGGGSGFVNIAANASYRPSGYTGIQLDSGETKAGNTSFPNTAGTGNETGHAGNGYAKITRFAAYIVTLRFKDDEDSPVTGASVTVSNSEYSYSLTTDSNGEATSTVINGTYTVNCQGYSLDVTSISVTGNQTFDFAATELLDFSYTGAAQTKTLKPGTYKIECWGAQGGSYSSTYHGGYGGYSVGEITLEEQTTIYVMVGGQGTGGTSSGAKAGGFNGGGLGYSTSTTYIECGGGGASDVRIGQNSLYARVIVAGGGGGAGSYSSSSRYVGGAGGGTSGVTGGQYSTSYKAGTGGSQTARGSSYYDTTANSTTYGTLADFGTGAGAKSGTTSYQITGGGGGWYGGGYSRRGGGGGGSGYVYTEAKAANYPSGCLLNSSHYLANSQTIAGNASMPSTSGGTETGHSGNGFIRITKI